MAFKPIWDWLTYEQRTEVCKVCGWCNRTAKALARKSWEQQSIAFKNVVERYYEAGKFIGIA